METINNVLLSGKLAGDAWTDDHGGDEYCFEIVTYRIEWVGESKNKIPETHLVKSSTIGPIKKYLKKGKSVIVQGRLDKSHVLATSITFP